MPFSRGKTTRRRSPCFARRALELEPDNEALHLKLAGFYQLIGKWPEAAAYQKLTSLNPTDEKL
jgi:hypothetical protein